MLVWLLYQSINKIIAPRIENCGDLKLQLPGLCCAKPEEIGSLEGWDSDRLRVASYFKVSPP